MPIYGIIFFIFAFLVGFELLVHIIYHAVTGKAGLNDPAFDYILRRKRQ